MVRSRKESAAEMVVNAVAISIFLSTLAAAGIWSLSPYPVVGHVHREGHRIIIVEYDRELPDQVHDAVVGAKEAVSDAVAHVADTAKCWKDMVPGDDISKKASEMEETVEKTVATAAERARTMVEHLRSNLTDIANRVKEAASRVLSQRRSTAEFAASAAHLLGFTAAYGTCLWVSFISSHVLATALPRQQFAIVQSRIYPVYFHSMAYSVGAAIIGQFIGRKRDGERIQGFNLLFVLALILLNMLVLEPKATKVMFERMKMEKEEARGRDMADILEPLSQGGSTVGVDKMMASSPPSTMEREKSKMRLCKLSKRLKMLNGYSSMLNLATLMAMTWHLMHLAAVLQSSSSLR